MGEESALDAALAALGHFRAYQQYVMSLLSILSLCLGLLYHSHALELQDPPHSCLEQECQEWMSPALPDALDALDCPSPHYLHNDTLYAELDLACRDRLREALELVQGCLRVLGLLLGGFLADRFGRRPGVACVGVPTGAAALATACGLTAAGLPLPALAAAGMHIAIVIGVETGMPSLRAAFSCLPRATFAAGGVLAAASGVLRPAAAALGPALLVPAAALLLPESARWLHAAGRTAALRAAIRRAARWNKVSVDEAKVCGAESESRAQGWRAWRAIAALVTAAAAGGALAGRGGGAADLTATVLAMMALQRWDRRGTAAAAIAIAGVARAGAGKFGGRALPAVARGAAELAACGVTLAAAESVPAGGRALAVSACGAAAALAHLLATTATRHGMSAGPAAVLWVSVAAAGGAACALLPAPVTPSTPNTPPPPTAPDPTPNCISHL